MAIYCFAIRKATAIQRQTWGSFCCTHRSHDNYSENKGTVYNTSRQSQDSKCSGKLKDSPDIQMICGGLSNHRKYVYGRQIQKRIYPGPIVVPDHELQPDPAPSSYQQPFSNHNSKQAASSYPKSRMLCQYSCHPLKLDKLSIAVPRAAH